MLQLDVCLSNSTRKWANKRDLVEHSTAHKATTRILVNFMSIGRDTRDIFPPACLPACLPARLKCRRQTAAFSFDFQVVQDTCNFYQIGQKWILYFCYPNQSQCVLAIFSVSFQSHLMHQTIEFVSIHYWHLFRHRFVLEFSLVLGWLLF